MVERPTLKDVARMNSAFGTFPLEKINQCFENMSLDINVKEIPRSFDKYFAVMKALVPTLRGTKIIDFGCGLGVFVSQAARLGMITEGLDMFSEYRGRCYDAAQCVVSGVAMGGMGPLPILNRCDILQVDFSAKNADFVVSFGMLEHIHGVERRDRIIGQMMRALRPGGYLILTCGPNRLFPVDLFHYGPKFVFYHQLPVGLRQVYLRLFSRQSQCQDAEWLNGMSVKEICRAIDDHGGCEIEQMFPLWVELSSHPLMRKPFVRALLLLAAKWLTKMKAEPVIILVARKR